MFSIPLRAAVREAICVSVAEYRLSYEPFVKNVPLSFLLGSTRLFYQLLSLLLFLILTFLAAGPSNYETMFSVC